MAERLKTFYSDESAYGRAEQGRRLPDRDYALAILVRGLEIKDLEVINQVLSVGGFAGVAESDVQRLGLEQPAPAPVIPESRLPGNRVPAWLTPATSSAILAISAASSIWIAMFVPNHLAMVLGSTAFYSLLFVVSLLLEGSYLPNPKYLWPLASCQFGFMLVSSVSVLAFDATMASAMPSYGLLLAVALMFTAAGIQWISLRSYLPSYSLATARFQLLGPQAAHLKNTGYVLLLAIIFWLPPFHAVVTLEREWQNGNAELAREIVSRHIIAGQGMFALNTGLLSGIWVLLILVSIPMGSHLIDQMKPHPRLNSFYLFFYTRAFLYFALSASLIGWFAIALAAYS